MAKSKKKKIKKIIRPTIKRVISILLDYSPKKFPNRKTAIDKAREIVAELKKTGESATIGNVLSFVRVKRVEKFIPKLPPEMSSVQNYFVLVNYPNLILTEVDPRITIVSRVSNPSLPPIKGLTEIDYDEYFSDFVNYCNELASLSEEGRYEKDWFVTTRLIDEKRYVFEIIPCTGDGAEFYYGFDRTKSKKRPDKPITTDKGAPPEEKEKPKDKTEGSIEAKARQLEQYNKTLEGLRQDVKDGLLSKEDYRQIVMELTKKLEEGGNIT